MKILRRIGKIFITFLFIFTITNLICYTYALITPKIQIKNANKFYIYDKNNNLIFQGSGTQEWVHLDEISPYLINATISVEDKNFYNHKGFDFLRITKAIFENIKHKGIVQGASTITQQYAKNLFLNFEKSWKRKWKEMWLTFEIETHYKKNEILEGYLNTINYGHGMYGIENASKFYFNKSAKDLNLEEASILAGIPNSPNNYSPINNYKLSKKRQKNVLTRMYKNKYITYQELKDTIKNNDIYIYGKVDSLNLKTLMYYQDTVMEELKLLKKIPNNYLERGSLKIYTNLDVEAQSILEHSMDKNLTNDNIQFSSIIMTPTDGSIIALTGGRDYNKSQYNRATKSKRQPGSAIKPFLYYVALENGFTPSTTFYSGKTTFALSNNEVYSPKNFNNLYGNKNISLGAAIAYSDNIYAIKTHLFLGKEALPNIVKRLDMKVNIDEIASSPLGSNEINIIDIAKGYSAFANNGYKVIPHTIRKIEDENGNILYEFKEEKKQVLREDITFILSDLLSTTTDKNMIDYNYPTCIGIAPKLSKKYAIKSGTTDTDSWIIGYNKDILIANWMGYDKGKNISNKDSSKNKNIWADTIEKYLKNKDTSWYEIPDNVIGILVDPISGEIATKKSKNKRIMYYLKGTEPHISTLDNNF